MADEKNLFLVASRRKFRFTSVRGDLTAEQLWDLPLKSSSNQFDLDSIARALNRELKAEEEESFVVLRSSPKVTLLRDKLNLVKEIIAIKIDDARIEAERKERAARRSTLLDALEQKEKAALLQMTPEQIKEELARL
jgi:hypothetical protein